LLLVTPNSLANCIIVFFPCIIFRRSGKVDIISPWKKINLDFYRFYHKSQNKESPIKGDKGQRKNSGIYLPGFSAFTGEWRAAWMGAKRAMYGRIRAVLGKTKD
jgi:hypothetical protein